MILKYNEALLKFVNPEELKKKHDNGKNALSDKQTDYLNFVIRTKKNGLNALIDMFGANQNVLPTIAEAAKLMNILLEYPNNEPVDISDDSDDYGVDEDMEEQYAEMGAADE